MERPLESLKLDSLKKRELKLCGFRYLQPNASLKEVLEEYENLSTGPETKSALELLEGNSNEGTIFTFIRGLDEVLRDEIVPGGIVELCGESGTGKTQICFHLCVNVQFPKIIGGRGGESVFISTNYGFSKSRISEIAISKLNKLSKISQETEINLSLQTILSKINHIKITKYEELIAIVRYLKTLLKTKTVRLIVIDNISFLADQIEFKLRKCILYTLFSELQKLAEKHRFTVVITNNVTSRNTSSTEITKIPALGENFYHRINSRIELSRLGSNCYKAKLVKSVCNGFREVCFGFSLKI